MKNLILLYGSFFVSFNLIGMDNYEPSLFNQLRYTPIGQSIMLSGRPWIIEENSLFLQTMGKAVLLNKIECCGKVVTELRQTVMFGVSPTTRKKIFICFPSSRITPWGMFVGGSTLLGLGTALATTILFGKS